MNINTITQINKSYIFTNDNGKQDRIKTNKEDIGIIFESLEIELKHIDYMIIQLSKESNMYNAKIDGLNNNIDSLCKIIGKGISEGDSKYIRGLSNEQLEVECMNKKLQELFNSRSGINRLSCKMLDMKNHYQELVKECSYILRG